MIELLRDRRRLERRLVGLDLGDLLAGLPAGPPATAATVLGDSVERVLRAGLGDLPDDALDALGRHPAALLDLQEQVLLRGGPYWQRVEADIPEVAALARTPAPPASPAPRPPARGWWMVPAAAAVGAGLMLGGLAVTGRLTDQAAPPAPPPEYEPSGPVVDESDWLRQANGELPADEF